MHDPDLRDEELDQEGKAGISNEALLKEIRDRYDYADRAFSEIRDEAKTDRRYVAGDPWSDEDRRVRKDAGRPCISHDEINQYINQYVNGIRQSPPGITIEPAGQGTSNETAQLRQDLVRTIEYQSDAQSAYIGAAQAAAEGSYGFFRVTRQYASEDSFDQNIRVKAIINPDSVLYDPDCKEPDWSDARFVFVLEPMPREEFARQYPNAQKTSFTSEDTKLAPNWIQQKTIMVAEYWRAEMVRKTIYLLDSGKVVDKLPAGTKSPKKRVVQARKIVQYITNGIEILKRTEQPGTIIPIIAVTGKEMYVDDGGGAKRRLFSLVRMARDPQMSLAYLNSLEMEEAGLTPKVPYMGYKGQFESDAETWEELTKVPHAFVQVDVVSDGAQGVLPLPQRVQFTPNFAAYEVAKDSCRRAIMSAMGIMPLPTAAQRDNQKSGIAIQKIQQQQSVGSYHFTSNLHRAMRLGGLVIEQWIPKTYDGEREQVLRKDDGSSKIVKLNTAEPYRENPENEQSPLEHYPVSEGEHEVTISVGPSSESTREAASDFLDSIISNLPKLPIPPPAAAKLLAKAIKGKQLGPLGDEMAEIISPDEDAEMPPQAHAAIAQAQGIVQQLQQKLAELEQEKQGKVVENQFRLEIEKLKAQSVLDKVKLEADLKIAIAEIQTKAQSATEREQMYQEVWSELHGTAHEAATQASDQAHELAMQQAEQAHEAEQAQQGQQFQAQQAQDAQAATESQAGPQE